MDIPRPDNFNECYHCKTTHPDVPAIASQCTRFHVTRCAASPAFFEGLLAGGIPSLRKVYTGGAPVFPDLLRRLRAALPDAVIDSVYGSTEAEPIAHFPAHEANGETDGLTRQGGGLCSGIPVPEIELRIVSDRWGSPLTGNEIISLSAGEAGEIIVRGDHVLRGYLGGSGDGETKIPDGGTVWHRTGDAGWLDSRGRVWLLGRCAEKLPPYPATAGIPSDALSYPFAIECALRELFPGIRMAALEWKGQRSLVVGKLCDPESTAAIRASAAVFGIHQIIHLASIPLDRRHNAKIDYPALRELLENEKPRPD
ncbi:MAG: hypothetical protein EOP85_17515 [Verrucomicrobiaceae bacterium]|nr:MAG: hypothetical protein EOP85_17515 [Verrucomicrobiaceae bacterium]